jgi:hypothetical protein
LIKRAEATYKVEVVKSKINYVKPSKNKKFIAIEILKDPHPYGAVELKTVEYLFYKATEGQMHSSKVTLHLDKSFPHDFDLSDEV